MKRIFAFFCAAIAAVICPVFGIISSAENKKAPVYADGLNEGSYSIEVTSSSSMFKIVDCTLTVSDGKMTAVMTLSGKGYEKLFMGTGEEALASGDESCIYFAEDTEGKYTYTVPVEALNADIDCAAWSIKKQEWYDRVLVFEADSLPKEAFAAKSNALAAVIAAAAAVIIAAAVVIIILKKKSKVQ